MGLKAKGAPDSTDGALTQAAARGHRARAPVRRIARGRLQRQRHYPLNLGVGDGPWRAGPRLIEQAIHALDQEPLPPLADRILIQAQLARDGAVRLARGALQHHARTLSERLGCGSTPRPALQHLAFVITERQRGQRPTWGHARPPLYRRTRPTRKMFRRTCDSQD
jgi:hypothetical protein